MADALNINAGDEPLDDLLANARSAFANGDYKRSAYLFASLKNKQNTHAYDADLAISNNRHEKDMPPLISIMDEFSHESWSGVFNLHPLYSSSCEEAIDRWKYPLFMETAWAGLDKTWQYAMAASCRFRPIARLLKKIVEKVRGEGRPVIFWNKEDPLHFHDFSHIAKLATVVLTTDSNMLDQYRKICPDAQVECLPFAANIQLCNPAGRFYTGKAGTICFAGSNYIAHHNDRVMQLKLLLPLIEHFSGTIYDRNHGLSNTNRFPERYQPFVKAPVSFVKMADEYRHFKFFLNVNTVTDSPTMLARRVYELLASCTPVISWPSKALESQFPDIVLTATSFGQAKLLMEDYLNDDDKWKRLAHRGYREVMTKHTYQHRKKIVERFLNLESAETRPKVSIILSTMRPQFIDRIADNICGQTWADMEAIIFTQGWSPEQRLLLAGKLRGRRPGLYFSIKADDGAPSLGSRYNRMIAMAQGQYVAKFDDDDFYFPNYLADMILPFNYTSAGVVGKRETYFWLDGPDETHKLGANRCHCLTDRVTGATIIFRKSLFPHLKFQELTEGEDTAFLEKANARGIGIYSADPFNYAVYRNFQPGYHTFNLDIDYFRRKTLYVGKGFRKDIIVI